VIVRVNALDTPHFGDDLEAVVRPGLDALLLPKIMSADDVVAFDALVRLFELRAGMPVGSVGLIPSLETARGLAEVEQIAAAPRVVSLMAAAAKDADVSREVGFRWTPEGLETLFLRSKVVLAARAVGLRHVVLGLWQAIDDLEGLRAFATTNAALGYGGQVLIHPGHVAVVNEVYATPETELERYRGMVAAYEEASARGSGAVLFRGEHVDLAHVQHAREVLAQHDVGGPR
jgi:citrate lyase subunit beta/citryl-CoA lyase